jgi:high-affinity Fe2+/Pb2+ permease
VYAWLWRKLPGPTALKAVEALVLFIAVVLVLFVWVFPWLEPRLPFNDVTITDTPSPSQPATPSASR